MDVSRRTTISEIAPIRAGIWLLGAAGALISLVWVLGFAVANADLATQTAKYVDQVRGAGFVWGLLYILGLALIIPGLAALTAMLYTGNNRTLAIVGLVAGSLCICALEAVFGVLTLANVVVAQLYKDGNTNVLPVLKKFEGGNLDSTIMNFFMVAVVIGAIAAVAYGIALWRSAVVPKWTVIVFALGFVLLAVSAPPTSLPGGILLAVSCFFMARASSPAPVMSAQPA